MASVGLGTCVRRIAWAACVLGSVACGANKPATHQAAPVPAPEKAPSAAPVAKEPPSLPEDPAAGKAAERQWAEHLDHEEEERQAAFDRNRLKEHRAVIKLLKAARARYDAARSEAALNKARTEMPARIAEIQKRVTELDHWGNNSRLLPDYAALEATLGGAYPDAKLAAIQGQGAALEHEREAFDERVEKMGEWLEEAEHGEEEGGREPETRSSQRERSERREPRER